MTMGQNITKETWIWNSLLESLVMSSVVLNKYTGRIFPLLFPTIPEWVISLMGNTLMSTYFACCMYILYGQALVVYYESECYTSSNGIFSAQNLRHMQRKYMTYESMLGNIWWLKSRTNTSFDQKEASKYWPSHCI